MIHENISRIGPDTLTEDTVSGVSTVPTVTDNLFTQGTIAEKVVAISFEPTTTDEVTNGELFFGEFFEKKPPNHFVKTGF